MPKAPDLAESDTTTGLPNDLGEDATPRQDGHVKGKAPEIPEVEISTPHAPAMSWVFGPVHIIGEPTSINATRPGFPANGISNGHYSESQPASLRPTLSFTAMSFAKRGFTDNSFCRADDPATI